MYNTSHTFKVKLLTAAMLIPLIGNANNLYKSKYQYNDFAEPVRVINQDLVNANQMSAFTYGYDKNGNAIVVTKIYGTTSPLILNYGYDALGHMVSDDSSNDNISYIYDLQNNLRSLADKNGTNNRSYNSLNELMSITGPSSNETFTYDVMDPNNILSDSDHNQYRYDVTRAISTYTSPTNQTIKDLYLGDGSLCSEQTSQGTQNFYFSGSDLINNNNPGEIGLTSYIVGNDGKDIYFDNNTTPGILLTDLNSNVIGAGELQGSSYKDYSYLYQDLDQNDPLSQKQAGDINLIGFGGGYFNALNQSQIHAMFGGLTNQQWMYVGIAGGGTIALGIASYGFYKFLQWWDPVGNEATPTNVYSSNEEEEQEKGDNSIVPEVPSSDEAISKNVDSSDKEEEQVNSIVPEVPSSDEAILTNIDSSSELNALNSQNEVSVEAKNPLLWKVMNANNNSEEGSITRDKGLNKTYRLIQNQKYFIEPQQGAFLKTRSALKEFNFVEKKSYEWTLEDGYMVSIQTLSKTRLNFLVKREKERIKEFSFNLNETNAEIILWNDEDLQDLVKTYFPDK